MTTILFVKGWASSEVIRIFFIRPGNLSFAEKFCAALWVEEEELAQHIVVVTPLTPNFYIISLEWITLFFDYLVLSCGRICLFQGAHYLTKLVINCRVVIINIGLPSVVSQHVSLLKRLLFLTRHVHGCALAWSIGLPDATFSNHRHRVWSLVWR